MPAAVVAAGRAVGQRTKWRERRGWEETGNDSVGLYFLSLTFTFKLIIIWDMAAKGWITIQREHFLPIVRSLYAVSGRSRFNELCREYGIVDMCRSIFRKRVWDVFISSVAF